MANILLHTMVLSLAVVWILEVQSCKIEFRVRSRTDKLFGMQMYMTAIKKISGMMVFGKKDTWYYVKFEGKECMQKPLIVKTWEFKGSRWIPAKEIRSYVDGDGFVELHIEDNLLPSFRRRLRFLCVFGNCW